MFLFPFNKRKVISEVWVLAASNSFGSVFEVKAVATGKCQRVDFRFQPLFQTDPVLPPGGACGWPCLVFILCLATVPGSTSWPCRRLPLRPLGESEQLTCSLQCPVSLCFRSRFLLLATSFHFSCVLRGVTSLDLGFPWCLFLWFCVLISSHPRGSWTGEKSLFQNEKSHQL